MPDGDFEWVSADKCRDIGLLINHAEDRIAIIKTKLLNYRKYEKDEKNFSLEMHLTYPPEMQDVDDDYPLASEVMTIMQAIIGENKHNLRAKYFSAACTYSKTLICTVISKKHYVVPGQVLRLYFDCRINFVKVYRATSFKYSHYVASYIASSTAQRQQFKHHNVKKILTSSNNAPYDNTIDNVARRADIYLLNNMRKARKLDEKPYCVDFRVFNGQVVSQKEEVAAAVADKHRQ